MSGSKRIKRVNFKIETEAKYFCLQKKYVKRGMGEIKGNLNILGRGAEPECNHLFESAMPLKASGN